MLFLGLCVNVTSNMGLEKCLREIDTGVRLFFLPGDCLVNLANY
jgi:hypothetical protein